MNIVWDILMLHSWKATWDHLNPSGYQQHIHTSFSVLILFTLKESLYAGEFAADSIFCLFTLAPTATTMSSTLSCWRSTSPSPQTPLKLWFGGLLADVSKNIIPWFLAKLMACSWFTWWSAQWGVRRSLLFPTRNLWEQNISWYFYHFLSSQD